MTRYAVTVPAIAGRAVRRRTKSDTVTVSRDNTRIEFDYSDAPFIYNGIDRAINRDLDWPTRDALMAGARIMLPLFQAVIEKRPLPDDLRIDEEPAPAPEPAPEAEPETMVLVACVGGKTAFPTRARDLYCTPWFHKARRYAEKHGDSWLILSAAHGVVDPDEVIHPYDQTLNKTPVAERREWARDVVTSLTRLMRPGQRVTILGGIRYREFVANALRGAGFAVTEPMAGLGIGQQLQWLGEAVR